MPLLSNGKLKTLLNILSIAAICFLLFATRGAAERRYFAVRDSVEMTTFSDCNHFEVLFSPDKKYFAFVTSRGILQSDTIESTIWIFKTDVVRSFLQSGDSSQAHRPIIAARWIAVPRPQRSVDTEAVISHLQWLPNSKTVLFLAQNSNGAHQLYKTDLSPHSVRALTPRGYDVAQFAWTHNTIIYEVASSNKNHSSVGEKINADASDITGLPIQALFPQESVPDYNELWVSHNGENVRISNPRTTQPLRLANSFPSNTLLSISPDGRTAVVMIPIKNVPNTWKAYEPHLPMKRIDPQDPNEISPLNSNRLVQYALVDLTKGTTMPLINAPHGSALGVGGPASAVWSSDGKRLLLTDTFLPLDERNAMELRRRVHACAVVVIDTQPTSPECVRFDNGIFGEKSISVLSTYFSQHNDEIIVEVTPLYTYDPIEERYHYENGDWKFVASDHFSNTNPIDQLSVIVKQNLNTPPTLWATDPRMKRTYKLWDPNPQFAGMNLGEASIFRWKDASGYKWVAALAKPPNYIPGKRYPLVIQTHDINPEKKFLADGAATTAFAARPLASAGIIVLQMPDNHRHEPSFREASDQSLGYESAIKQLTTDGLIDPRKVGIIGFSRASYYVENALIKNPKFFAAASITDGVDESYIQYLIYGASIPGFANEGNLIYGTAPFGKDLSVWIKEAPGFNLERVRTPLLIGAIGLDSILTEWELYASLQIQKKPVDMMYIPDGEHQLLKPLERLASQQTNVDWFRFWLQGYEDPDPAKAAQYKRWKALRELQEQNQSKNN